MIAETRGSAQDKGAEIEFFDQFGDATDYDVFDERGYARILHEFQSFTGPGAGDALDMGCGTGAFTKRIPGLGYRTRGMDISPKCIEAARRRHPSIEFDVGDIEHTHYADASFDAVFLSGVIHHFPDFSHMLREARRVLKPRGALLAYDPHGHNPIMWAYRCKESPFYSSKGVTENERPVTKAALLSGLRDAGFTEAHVRGISGVTYRYVDSRVARFALPIYNAIERAFDVPFVRDTFGSFVITCARR